MKIKIVFTDIEVEFLLQVVDKFMFENKLTDFPLKNKLMLNESLFDKEEVVLLYLYLRVFKQTIEKHLDNPYTYDENLRLNYKGVNHCLRKCRKALEEQNVYIPELENSYDEFFESFVKCLK